MISPNNWYMRLTLVSLIFLPLTGCASDAYYNALAAQFQAEKAQYAAMQAAKVKEEARPLVNFSWTDEYGVTHTMIVNQPSMSYHDPEPEPRLHIPSPWEGPFRFFDRALSTGERLLPWFINSRGQSDSGNISYTFGDGAYFQQSRDFSPQELHREISTVTNPTSGGIE